MVTLLRTLAMTVMTLLALLAMPGQVWAWRVAQSAPQAAATAPDSPGSPAPDSPGSPAHDAEGDTPAVTKDGTPATVIDDREVEGILGKSVRSTAGEDMGRIVDVIVNRDGQVRAAVIDFGGFLGVGSRKIAVDWSALRFPPDGKTDHVIVELNRDQVRLAPEYRPGEPVVVLGAVETPPEAPENPAAGN